MAEPKRITVTQVETVKPPEKKQRRRFAHRFTLSLDRSTEKTCPEYSFNDLLKKALDDAADFSDPDDPFGQHDRVEHERLEAIAKSFEEKYAQKKPKKKKKGPYNRIQEFVDLGDGYDEADPFIDNTEAYDELVPSCLTTQHGGFYINSGKLDFRVVSDDDDDDFQTTGNMQKKRKKNMITSDSDSESIPKKKGPKKKFLTEDELRKKKRKKLSSTDSMDRPMLKRKKFNRDGYKVLKLKKKKTAMGIKLSNSTPNGIAANITNGSKPDQDADKMDAAPMSTAARQNMESAIDSVISQSRKMDVLSDEDNSPDQSMSPKGNSSQSSNPQNVPKLPEPLPPRLVDLVTKLKQAASEAEKGIKKFFTANVNQMLLQVENGSRQLPASIRNGIYCHLAGYLPCGKETLIKRAKKLCHDHHEEKLKQPKSKLKEGINKLMPGLIEKHQQELQTVQQMKNERKQESREAGSTESDEDGEKPDGDKQKRIMAPRRKFEWSHDLRGLLNQIVQTEMKHFETSKIRSQTPEDYLKAFLEQEIKPLWPQGWIQTRMLFKESRVAHQNWTTPGFRSRKPVTITTGGNLSTPGSSRPNTPVSGGSSVTSMTTTTTSTVGGANTNLVPNVQKHSESSGSSSDSSYSSSDSSDSAAGKTILDYAGEKSRALDSKAVVVLSKTSVIKPELKASGSTGFPTPGDKAATTGASAERTATQALQNITDSISKIKPPPVIMPVVAKPVESSQMTFLEQFYQFAAGSQSVSSTTGESLPPSVGITYTTAPVVSAQQTKVKQAVTTTSTLPRASSTTPKTDSRTATAHHGISTDSRKTAKPQDLSGRTINPATKPHLAAALQGMYFPTTAAASGSASQQGHHSQLSSTSKHPVSVKPPAQKVTGNSSSQSQVKVFVQSRGDPKLQVSRPNTATGPVTGTSQHKSVPSSSSNQKQVSSTTNPPSQSSKGISQADVANKPGKKLQVTSECISKLKANLTLAVNQRAMKAQEKVMVWPLDAGLVRSSPVASQLPQLDLSQQPKRVSPVSPAAIAQKVMTPIPQALGSITSVVHRKAASHGTQQSSAAPRTMASQSVQSSAPARTMASQSVQSSAPARTVASQSVQSSAPARTVASQSVQSSAPARTMASQSVQSSAPARTIASQSVQSSAPARTMASQNVQSSVAPRTVASQSAQQSRTLLSHSPQHNISTAAAHSMVSQGAVFVLPSPVSTGKTVAINQVSSTSSARSPQVQDYKTKVSSSGAVDHKKAATPGSGSKPSSISQSHGLSPARSPSTQTVSTRPAPAANTASKSAASMQAPRQGQSSVHSSSTRSPAAAAAHSNRGTPSSHSKTNQATSSQATGNRQNSSSPAQQASNTRKMSSSPSPQATGNRQISSTPSPQGSSSRLAVSAQAPSGRPTQHTTTNKSAPSIVKATHTAPSPPTANCGTPLSSYKIATYPQISPTQTRADSTSPSRGNEPKFGGYTLSQLQEQTLKASQKAHIQSAQYAVQSVNTPATYRASDNAAVYGTAQLSNYAAAPARTTPSITGYDAVTPASLPVPTSPSLHQTQDIHQAASALYGMSRSPQVISHQNSTIAQSLFPSVPVSPRASLLPYNLSHTDPQQRRY